MLNVTWNFLWLLATIIGLRRYGRLFLATAEFFVSLNIYSSRAIVIVQKEKKI